MITATVTALLLAVMPFQSTQQFDLVCTGEMTTGSRIAGYETTAWAPRFRINLTNNTWCSDTCTRVAPIVRVDAAEIVLNEDNTADMQHSESINRSTGQYHSSLRLGALTQRASAQCQRADFSGMPTAAF